MSVKFLIDVFIFIFGLCIGSFLNCVIYRLERKEKLAGRSHCTQCQNTLAWTDLFPVFSFLCLWGKCRYCKGKISWQYPIVEISTALIFLLIYNLQFTIYNNFSIFQFFNLAFLLYIASALTIIFVYDLKYYIIPDKVLFPAIGITFFYRLFENMNFVNWNLEIGNFAPIGRYFLAAIIASGFFLFIFLFSRGCWMGLGDVKLAILMGFLLGLPNVLVALFLAFFSGAIIGTIMMIFRKKNLKSEIPFGPFLITGTFIAIFWGTQMVQWYMRLFSI